MGKTIKKRIKNSPKWKQNSASYKRRTGKTGRHAGLGRYILGLTMIAVVFHFYGRPAIGHIMSHPIFNIRRVVVDGSQYIDSDKIIDAASIEIGKNIFEIDVVKVSENLESAFAAEDFTVFKSLPNSITIRVNERKPVALLNAKKLIGVDKDGVPLPHIGADLVESLPIVSGINSISSLSDSAVKARLDAGLRLLAGIKEKAPSTYKRISEINVSNMNMLGFSLIDNGLEIIIGEKDWTRKIPALDKIINEVTFRSKSVKALDFRFSEMVVVKK